MTDKEEALKINAQAMVFMVAACDPDNVTDLEREAWAELAEERKRILAS